MMMDKIRRIEEHFANISDEEFEENLIKSGFGEIKSLEEYGLKLKEVDKDDE